MTPGQQIGRYRLVRMLGKGGMGIVYLADDTVLDRPVAIKGINVAADDPEAVQILTTRILKEARTVAALKHPAIVCIYDVVLVQSAIYLVMEYVDGDPLTELFDRSLNLPDRFRILHDVAEALDCAHGRGVIHRDVKPGNIMVTRDLEAKLTDFGIAKILGSDTQTTGGLVLGTLEFMAPEQIKGEAVDGRADQFSLAVLSYAFLTGQRAFEGSDPGTLSYKICHVQPALPSVHSSCFNRDADERMMRALAKDPGQRFPSCLDFINALQDACREASPSLGAKRSSRARTPGSRRILRWLWFGAVAALCIGMVVAIVIVLRTGSPTKTVIAPATPGTSARERPVPASPSVPPPTRSDANDSAKADSSNPPKTNTSPSTVRPANRHSAAESPLEVVKHAKALYNAKNYSAALPLLKKAAFTGNAEAQAYLGSIYLEGLGTLPDFSEAAHNFRMAANGGEPRGMIGMGFLAEFGKGVPQDYSQAMHWYRKAANAGNGPAMLDVGRLYEFGKGVPKDYSQAMHWYRQAASAGITEAMNNVGILYENGWGVAKDAQEAVRWYANAAEAGNVHAKTNLTRLNAGN